jgi:uncharacterized membrane protein YcaP (DUF421 family)
VDPLRIAVRALFAFVVLHALLRASGKRFVAEATGFDFVLALILGDVVDDLLWAEVPASQFTVAAATLVLARLGAALASAGSPRAAALLGGVARLIVQDGSPLRPAMRAERMNRRELAEALRREGLEPHDWQQVRSARLERSGRVSVLRKPWAQRARRADADRLRDARPGAQG